MTWTLDLSTRHTHIRVVLLQKLSNSLQEGHKEFTRLAKHPTRLSNENTQENSTDLQLVLSCTVCYCKIFWNLKVQSKKKKGFKKKTYNVLNSLYRSSWTYSPVYIRIILLLFKVPKNDIKNIYLKNKHSQRVYSTVKKGCMKTVNILKHHLADSCGHLFP